MDFDELAIMAFGGNHPPDGANTIELAAYCGLRYCYDAYRHGVISRDEASRKKRKLETAYKADCAMYAMYAEGANRQRAVESMIKIVQCEGCEICKRIFAMMDGREKI